MDNGSQKSLSGLPAYKRYCNKDHFPLNLRSSTECFKLGNSIHSSLGTAFTRMPVHNFGNFLEYETDVMNVDIPVLFGLAKIIELKWFINEVTNEFCSHRYPEHKIKLLNEKGHLYLKWLTSVVLFTLQELFKIHHCVAYPSAHKLAELMALTTDQQVLAA